MLEVVMASVSYLFPYKTSYVYVIVFIKDRQFERYNRDAKIRRHP